MINCLHTALQLLIHTFQLDLFTCYNSTHGIRITVCRLRTFLFFVLFWLYVLSLWFITHTYLCFCLSGAYNQNLCAPGDQSCAPCPDRLPSCVGLPDGDEPDTHHQWTDVYVRCYRNRTMDVQHCPTGAVFSPAKLACISKIGSGKWTDL